MACPLFVDRLLTTAAFSSRPVGGGGLGYHRLFGSFQLLLCGVLPCHPEVCVPRCVGGEASIRGGGGGGGVRAARGGGCWTTAADGLVAGPVRVGQRLVPCATCLRGRDGRPTGRPAAHLFTVGSVYAALDPAQAPAVWRRRCSWRPRRQQRRQPLGWCRAARAGSRCQWLTPGRRGWWGRVSFRSRRSGGGVWTSHRDCGGGGSQTARGAPPRSGGCSPRGREWTPHPRPEWWPRATRAGALVLQHAGGAAAVATIDGGSPAACRTQGPSLAGRCAVPAATRCARPLCGASGATQGRGRCR